MRLIKVSLLVLLLLPGCASRADKHIKNGLEALELASIKITEHNLILYNEKLEKLRGEQALASTEEERAEIQKQIDEELSFVLANEKMPVAIKKLKDWANGTE